MSFGTLSAGGGCVDANLTKAHLLGGLQCARRAWLEVHAPQHATTTPPGRRALLDAGRAIGRAAHALFPGAVLVDEPSLTAACARTQALLADATTATILEPAFVHGGIAVRPDVLERLGDGTWRLCEVKSGTRVRDVHLDDLAVQLHVLRGGGMPIASIEVIHVDGEYVYEGGAIVWPRLFTRADVTAEVTARLPEIGARIQALRTDIASTEAPAVEPSPHCKTPYPCPYWAHCTRDHAADWILRFGHVRPELWATLQAAGIARLGDITDAHDVPLMLRRASQVLQTGREIVMAELAAALHDFGPPADYLDFETISLAVPLYPGTRPYERIPFLWSLHRRDVGGTCTHADFLADGRSDPRRAVAEALLASTRDSDRPILVYSEYESDVLAELASALPDLAADLEALRARLRDLLPIMRAHVYHPEFRGSFSLKAVAPALVPGFGYGDLDDDHDGAEATTAFARIVGAGCAVDEEARVRSALRAYCARDTEALVRLHDALRARAA
jgi:predicted RecB family nuclease